MKNIARALVEQASACSVLTFVEIGMKSKESKRQPALLKSGKLPARKTCLHGQVNSSFSC
jgi:hypothetical protein